MTVYIDNEFRCHAADDGTMRSADVPFFDGMCTEFIEGYRYIPDGETWTRSDGQTFTGEMIAPWTDYNKLWAAQAEYELKQYEAALSGIESALGVNA